ncbi:MAG: ATP-binding protein [Flavobacteriaceae bacterium]|nr:ATP-binding protein [Flavobacteriaceae bacterium]
MINKRLLIKNLLAHNDENSFYDKKRHLNISVQEGKAKFLKHVCALSNSNPNNSSYIVIGVEDNDNQIVGVDFFDDSKIQNLINAYLTNPPLVAYENIRFPDLPKGKVVGLVSIRSLGELCSLRKNVWKYYGGMVFFREGSTSKPRSVDVDLLDYNSELVARIEQNAKNNIEYTLDGVIDFLNNRHKDLESYYKVFKEQFVVCWAGIRKVVKQQTYYSRVDIELINEQVQLFYSALDEVRIEYDQNLFKITEYVQLGLGKRQKYYPLEEVQIEFSENGSYQIQSKLLFEPPQFEKKQLFHIYNANNSLLGKIQKGIPLQAGEQEQMKLLPASLLICYLNGFEDAIQQLEAHRSVIKMQFPQVYIALKEALRVLRKLRYSG